jgi:hypothetical protein
LRSDRWLPRHGHPSLITALRCSARQGCSSRARGRGGTERPPQNMGPRPQGVATPRLCTGADARGGGISAAEITYHSRVAVAGQPFAAAAPASGSTPSLLSLLAPLPGRAAAPGQRDAGHEAALVAKRSSGACGRRKLQVVAGEADTRRIGAAGCKPARTTSQAKCSGLKQGRSPASGLAIPRTKGKKKTKSINWREIFPAKYFPQWTLRIRTILTSG